MSIIKLEYDEVTQCAVLSSEENCSQTQWAAIRRICEERGKETISLGDRKLCLPWWSFLSFRDGLRYILYQQKIKSIDILPSARKLLKESLERQKAYQLSCEQIKIVPSESINSELNKLGFTRKLLPYQVRNVSKILTLPASATFSVPGSGKTTEALAFFFLTKEPADHLLIIAPKNAFMAWEDELEICAPDCGLEIVRLKGGFDNIKIILETNPKIVILNYHQLPNVQGQIINYLTRNPSFLFLDESHRMKRGMEGVHGSAVLSLAHLAKRKLIMSGTPMPNSTADLVPQFSFLYPEFNIDYDSVVSMLRPVFVRTTKDELGLVPPKRIRHKIDMSPGQNMLYEVLCSDAARRLRGLDVRDRIRFRAFAKSVQHLLQAASNPALLVNSDLSDHPLLQDAIAEGLSPKIIETCRITRELTAKSNKVLIWTFFVKSVEHISFLLQDLGAEYIHGGVSTSEDDTDSETREAKIRRFHDDPSCMVLVANPAAAAEGISLHHVCHHAIYVDRNYNAAQYLQSEDRIHRIGLKPGTETYIYILQSTNTIDESVNRRLIKKVDAMRIVLNDSSLNITPIDLDDLSDGLDHDDIEDLKTLLLGY